MKFARCQCIKELQPITPRKIAAAKRKVEKEKDDMALFPALARWNTAEDRIKEVQTANRISISLHRHNQAECWIRARCELRRLPQLTQRGILAYWAASSMPKDAGYFLSLLRHAIRQEVNCWRELRRLRVYTLVRDGKLPKQAAQAFIPPKPEYSLESQMLCGARRIQRKLAAKAKRNGGLQG